MRRISTLMVLALALGGLAGLHLARPALAAVQYPSGWNLVSGPEGSHLVGATGSLYTLQPGDSTYETVPAASALKSGWGYWAYFPSGGSLSASASATAYSVTPVAGAYIMVGDPSATGDASVSGAGQVLTYSPAGGYSAATTIPAGQGAFVLASGTVSLTAAAPPAPSVSAVPAPTAPTPSSPPPHSAPQTPPLPSVVTSAEGLMTLGIQDSDLPAGYERGATFRRISSNPAFVAGYRTYWTNTNPNVQNVIVGDVIQVYNVPIRIGDISADILSQAGVTGGENLGSQGVSDEDQAVFFTSFDPDFNQVVNRYVLVFRRGSVVGEVYSVDYAPVDSRTLVTAMARLIDQRLAAAGVPSSSQYGGPSTPASLDVDVPDQ